MEFTIFFEKFREIHTSENVSKLLAKHLSKAMILPTYQQHLSTDVANNAYGSIKDLKYSQYLNKTTTYIGTSKCDDHSGQLAKMATIGKIYTSHSCFFSPVLYEEFFLIFCVCFV